MNSIDSLASQTRCFICPTDVEIDQELSPKLKKIRAQAKKQLSLGHTVIPVATNLLMTVVKTPIQSFFKITLCSAGAGYITYLLIRGIFAGIVVDYMTQFFDLFSTNNNTQLQAGLNLTNGDQAGQFMIDTLVTIYVCSNFIFKPSYNKHAGKVYHKNYEPYFNKLLTKIRKLRSKAIEENNEKINAQLIIKLRKINRLYMHLQKDLEPYHVKPNISLNAPQQQENVDEDLENQHKMDLENM